MNLHRIFWLVPILGFLASARAAEPDPELISAEKTLQDAKVETTSSALLQFLRDRSLTNDDRTRLIDAVRSLGDDDFDTREKAVAVLIRAGRKALPFVRPAQKDKDPERARRAAHIIEEIDSGADTIRVEAAIRVLMDRRPDGSSAVLLAYLPAADDEATLEAVLKALLVLGLKDGKPDDALTKALTGKEPLARAAAAHVLGRMVPGQREAVRRLLADSDARVRYEAANVLVRYGDKEAVPTLIALLGDGPMPLGWRAFEILSRIAGDKAPIDALSDEAPAKRAVVADAWRGWWKDAAATTDLAKINLNEALLGVNLICEIPVDESRGRVWACRADGKQLWQITDISAPVDVQLLRNGHVLIAEWNPPRVTERDRAGKVVWMKTVTDGQLTTCRRLSNGNTFIATTTTLLEFDPKGTQLYSYKDPIGGSVYRAHRLPNGHLLFAASGGRIVELDAKGKEVRTVKMPIINNDWTSLEPLPGGRFLVAVWSAHRVMELDAAGKLLSEFTAPSPMSAVRLPNGNTLVACYNLNSHVIEYDRAGKEVWKLKIETRPFCIRRF